MTGEYYIKVCKALWSRDNHWGSVHSRYKINTEHTRTPITHDLMRVQGEEIAGLLPTWHFFRIILLPGSARAECRDRLLSAETVDRAGAEKGTLMMGRDYAPAASRLFSEKLPLTDSEWILKIKQINCIYQSIQNMHDFLCWKYKINFHVLS